jgi:6-phosphogluconolactonase
MAEAAPARWHTFATRDALVEALTARIAADFCAAVAAQGRVLFGASGGSTPKPVYERLAAMDLPWSALRVLIVDERFIAPDHESSNQRMIEASLLSGHADSEVVGLWSDTATLAAAAEIAEQRVRALAATMDLVLLGMGEDGHFASCFPTANRFASAVDPQASDLVLPITPMPPEVSPAIERLTLTWSYILRSRRIVLAITGARKREVLLQAMRDEDTARLPVAALFKPGMPDIDIYWSE